MVKKSINYCPFCAEKILRHIRHHGIYWFCSRCRQEVPNLDFMQVINTENKRNKNIL